MRRTTRARPRGRTARARSPSRRWPTGAARPGGPGTAGRSRGGTTVRGARSSARAIRPSASGRDPPRLRSPWRLLRRPLGQGEGAVRSEHGVALELVPAADVVGRPQVLHGGELVAVALL